MHTTRHIMLKILKANNKEKILKAARDKKIGMYREIKINYITSIENLKAIR